MYWPPNLPPSKTSPFPLVLWRFTGSIGKAVECRVVERPDVNALKLRIGYDGQLLESHVHRDKQPASRAEPRVEDEDHRPRRLDRRSQSRVRSIMNADECVRSILATAAILKTANPIGLSLLEGVTELTVLLAEAKIRGSADAHMAIVQEIVRLSILEATFTMSPPMRPPRLPRRRTRSRMR